MQRIVIIGGGISGCAAAYALLCAPSRLSSIPSSPASSGALPVASSPRVTLIEKRRIAAMASGWTLGGVRQSGRDPAELPIAAAAVALWPELNQALEADVEYRRGGNVRLARTPDEVDVIRSMVERQRTLGLDVTFIEGNDRVRAIAPAVSPNVLAASFCPTDGHANPLKTTRAFADAARRLGADLREGAGVSALRVRGERVTGVTLDDGTTIDSDCVIVAAGIDTPRLLRSVGLDLPLSIKVVHVVQTEPLAPTLAQAFGVANADCAGRQEADGRLRYTGGGEPWPGDPDHWDDRSLAPSPEEVHRVVHRVSEVLPVAGTARIHRTWSGLIDLTPDALPVLDAPMPGLVVAAGFSGHGFCLGPLTGRICADLARGRTPDHDLASFRLDRFARMTGAAPLTLHG